MTKAELVEAVATQSRLTKKSTARIIDTIFDNISRAVKNESRFSYPRFGTWSLRSRKARRIRTRKATSRMKSGKPRTTGFGRPRSSSRRSDQWLHPRHRLLDIGAGNVEVAYPPHQVRSRPLCIHQYSSPTQLGDGVAR